MKKTFIFILLVLFAGLAAFGGQSINGPGIQDFTAYEHEILTAPAGGIAIGVIPANGLTGVSPAIYSISPIIETENIISVLGYDTWVIPVDGIIKYTKGRGIFECTAKAYPGIWKGGVLSFDSGMKTGI
ncbi:MAG: hypothetical protein LBF78_16030 [Treponema sp.]|jgi:hypothetical protein|nr:hypothetical protein [Treponema sp.]